MHQTRWKTELSGHRRCFASKFYCKFACVYVVSLSLFISPLPPSVTLYYFLSCQSSHVILMYQALGSFLIFTSREYYSIVYLCVTFRTKLVRVLLLGIRLFDNSRYVLYFFYMLQAVFKLVDLVNIRGSCMLNFFIF